MLIVRAHASETALMEIIVAIEDTLQKGSGKLAPLIKPSDLIILNPGRRVDLSILRRFFVNLVSMICPPLLKPRH
jgi:hypothetical protein